MSPVPEEDSAALRPVTVKVIGERAARWASSPAGASGGGDADANANVAAAENNSTPDVRLITIQAAPNFAKSQIKAAVEQAGGPPVRHQRLLLSNVDALAVLDKRAMGALAGAGASGGASDGCAGASGGVGGEGTLALRLGVAPCGVASSASLALSGQPAVEAPAPKKEG